MADDQDSSGKGSGAGDSSAAASPDKSTTAAPKMTVGEGGDAKIELPPQTPPISPQQITTQLLGLQVGVGLPQQQNPEVIRRLTAFLSHDSDNRLSALEGRSKRSHKFRMNALYVGASLAILFFGLPLAVELYRGDILYRGDMTFVRDFVEKYLPVVAMIILALFAGPKFAELFRD